MLSVLITILGIFVAVVGLHTFGDDLSRNFKNSVYRDTTIEVEDGEAGQELKEEFEQAETLQEKSYIVEKEARKHIMYSVADTLLEIHDGLGDKQENKDGLLEGWDLIDWVKDKTSVTNDSQKKEPLRETVTSDIITYVRGQIFEKNMKVDYEQSNTAWRDYRQIEKYHGTIITAIRILVPYDYYNLYSYYPDKITDEETSVEIKEDQVIIHITKGVYKDTFGAEPKVDTEKSSAPSKLGFINENDPIRTQAEMDAAVERATGKYPQFYTPEQARTRTESWNTNSHNASEDLFYNPDNKELFQDFDDKAIKTDMDYARQISLALYLRKMAQNTKSEFFSQEQIINSLIEEGYEIDPSTSNVSFDVTVRLHKCKYENRATSKKGSIDFNITSFDWPEDIQDIESVIGKIPQFYGSKKVAKKLTNSQLKNLQEETINIDAKIPYAQGEDGTFTSDETFMMYDMKSLEEREKGNDKEGQDSAKASSEGNETPKISLAMKPKQGVTTRYTAPFISPEKFEKLVGEALLQNVQIEFITLDDDGDDGRSMG